MPDIYHHLGLRCNPFLAEQVPGVPESLWLDRGFSNPPQSQAQLLVQMIGEKGAGKTSHLLHWRRQTGGAYSYYPPGWRRWKLPPVTPIAYWDEADRIPKPLLLLGCTLAKIKGSTIVAGTHEDLAWAAKSVELPVQTILLPILSVEELMVWAMQRIEASRLSDSSTIMLKLTKEIAQSVAEQSGASWRQAATLLHIWAAREANRGRC